MTHEEAEVLIWRHLGCRPQLVEQTERAYYRCRFRDYLIDWYLNWSVLGNPTPVPVAPNVAVISRTDLTTAVELVRVWECEDDPDLYGCQPPDLLLGEEQDDDLGPWMWRRYDTLPLAIQHALGEFRHVDHGREEEGALLGVTALIRPRLDDLDEREAIFRFQIERFRRDENGPLRRVADEDFRFTLDDRTGLLAARQFIRNELPVEVLLDQLQDRLPDLAGYLARFEDARRVGAAQQAVAD